MQLITIFTASQHSSQVLQQVFCPFLKVRLMALGTLTWTQWTPATFNFIPFCKLMKLQTFTKIHLESLYEAEVDGCNSWTQVFTRM
jgi:ABC-type glycerol-3-phosphate transport system permease component